MNKVVNDDSYLFFENNTASILIYVFVNVNGREKYNA